MVLYLRYSINHEGLPSSPACHITFDVGAAISAYNALWNKPSEWSDIVIQLGDFHAMMAFLMSLALVCLEVDLRRFFFSRAYAVLALSAG